MSRLAIRMKLEAVPGATITETAEATIRLAMILSCQVEINFNGIKLIIQPQDSAAEIVARYHGRPSA